MDTQLMLMLPPPEISGVISCYENSCCSSGISSAAYNFIIWWPADDCCLEK
jgi:hypothetical protein